MINRRRALMMAQKADIITGLVPGIGYGKSTSTIVSVNNDGQIVIEKWTNGWANRFEIPFKNTVNIKTGDSLQLILKKVNGTTQAKFSSLWLFSPGWQLWSNVSTPFNSATIKSVTVTASNDYALSNLVMQIHSSDLSADYHFTMSVEIYVNGKLVLK